CRKHNILTIADEVLCGAARTGTYFASSAEGFEPDVIVMGKGLNGGYAPLSAMLVADKHLNVIAQESGHFMHAQTYINTPSSIAAGLEVMRYMKKHKVLENAESVGRYFQQELRRRFLSRPH